MAKIIGIIVILGSVLGGYMLSGGKIAAIIQPFEVLIIGGAALGAFLQANPGSTFMTVLKKAPKMFGNRFTHTFYLEVLGMLYEVLNKSRREGMMAIEADVEDPAASPIFSKYPAVLRDDRMTAYICDYLRIMSSGNMAPHELEGLFDMELGSLKEDLEHPAHAVTRVADALPGFGIVAAVLGIVITMALLGQAARPRSPPRRRGAGGYLPRYSRRVRFCRPSVQRAGARRQGRVEPLRSDQGLPGGFGFRHAALAGRGVWPQGAAAGAPSELQRAGAGRSRSLMGRLTHG